MLPNLAMHRNHPPPIRSRHPRPTAKPLTQHTHKNALNAATDPALRPKPLAQPRTPGQTPRPNPSRTPSSPAQTLARPDETHRDVLRVQNAPEPDSQSIKNNRTHASTAGRTHVPGPKRQTPPNGSDPALKAQTLSFHDTATRKARAHTTGGGRDRTDDLLLAKQALSQLSYAPTGTSQTAEARTHGGPGRTRTSDPTLIKRVL